MLANGHQYHSILAFQRTPTITNTKAPPSTDQERKRHEEKDKEAHQDPTTRRTREAPTRKEAHQAEGRKAK
jgi:hypothetical protein